MKIHLRAASVIVLFIASAAPLLAMGNSSIPVKFPIPWANSATSSYVRAIPTASQIGIQAGAASLTDGFPPLNFTPVSAGGVPPFGSDMNGIFKQITQWSRWYQAGGAVPYDSSFSSSIGGYPKNAIISAVSGTGNFWISTVDNNVTDPDTGGAGWVGFTYIGLAPLASPAFTGTPTAPTASGGTNNTQIATTAFATTVATNLVGVETSRALAAEALLAPLASPAFTGTPTAPTQSPGNNTTRLATTAFATAAVAVETSRAEAAEALLAPLNSAALTGSPTAPTPATSNDSTRLATTDYVQNNLALYATLASPTFTGNPHAPTQTYGTDNLTLATTAFVQNALNPQQVTLPAGGVYWRVSGGSITTSRTSGNVSSVTRSSLGNYVVHLSYQPFDNAYVATCSSSGGNPNIQIAGPDAGASSLSVDFSTVTLANTSVDPASCNVLFF